jgi:amino acid permease
MDMKTAIFTHFLSWTSLCVCVLYKLVITNTYTQTQHTHIDHQMVIFKPLKYLKLKVQYIQYKIHYTKSTIYIIQDCHGKSSIQEEEEEEEESFHQQIGLQFKE